VEGASNTRPAFLKALVAPLVLSQDNATLQSVIRATKAISQRLNETDIFQSVEAKIDRSQNALARDGDVDIVFKTRERGRLFLNTSTEVGNGEGNAVSR
jgi:outer membrane protein insertion porin family